MHARSAEYISWQLIEQDGQRKRAIGVVHPVFELATCRRKVRFEESFAEFRIEGIVAREPRFVAGAAPESHDIGRGGLRHAIYLMRKTFSPTPSSSPRSRGLSALKP